MKIVIAMDSFKGSMSTWEAGNAVKEGAVRVFPHARAVVCPMADGGEGSAEVIVSANHGIYKNLRVCGPLGDPVDARYGLLPDKGTAVLEMAAAAGLPLLEPDRRDPMRTTTYGVGEMIRDAIAAGCRKFIVGIGGSATNDGGIGMLSALGFEFLDGSGKPVPWGAEGLRALQTIRKERALPELAECTFLIACDVGNPLCGPNGCSAVYGPQKGADARMVQIMDAAMARYARLTKAQFPNADENTPGSGAAGGLGYAFMAYLGGTLRSGIRLLTEETGLEQEIRSADIVVTGEGRLDGQSCMGKTPVGVARTAKKYGKTVVAFAGGVTGDAGMWNGYGIDAFFSIVKGPCTLEEAMRPETAARNLADTAEQAFRLIRCATMGGITK